MCSQGAVVAATNSRGNRMDGTDAEGYQVILPTLPSGRSVFNTLFLHADVRSRPYRVEHFRDTLARLELLPDVIALGAYQMSHVWAVTFKSTEGMKKALACGEMEVKGQRCLVIDPANQDVRLKLHWLLFNVAEEDVRVALAPYGKVTDVTKEKWRVQGIQDKGSTTRVVRLKLHNGIKVDDLPHQLRVAGDMALLVAPGRAPLCLRCHSKGHIRRECRVPRCTHCRRFGHEESECVKTYASVAGPVGGDDTAELVMDEADAEEAAREATSKVEGHEAETSAPPDKLQDTRTGDESPKVADTVGDATGAVKVHDVPAQSPSCDEPTVMDVSEAASGATVSKRGHDATLDDNEALTAGNSDGPPPKAAITRRSLIRPRPNIPPDRKAAGTPPT
ncbi:uncharacterized protein LOC119462610 [Dermacentor silvarum]|uniref:uncharacterized protein LOC119462610 n=1 Tax=Dermacentor silvarum TaxID=543639 RepID=UPI00189B3150|nr:uncharacterized protein LOC119462610 [Dermacentor silvarum]